MSQGRNTVKSNFVAKDGVEGNEDAKNYEVIFNAQWAAKAKPLASKLAAFFVAIYKVGGMTAEDLKVEPGISNTQEVVTSGGKSSLTYILSLLKRPLLFLSLSFPAPNSNWSSVHN